MNRKTHVACNFNCLFKNEGLLKVASSHTVKVVISRNWCKIERDIVTTVHKLLNGILPVE